MNGKAAKGEEEPKPEMENIKEYWTEHRTTLIAYEAQYIYNKKPDAAEDDEDHKGKKGKKKDI